MNKRLRDMPPKQKIALLPGSAIFPKRSPYGEKTRTPSSSAVPMPQPHQRLPCTSTLKPSGVPSPASNSTRPPLSDRPSVDTSKRSEEHTSELQSLMRISYAVFCLKNKKTLNRRTRHTHKYATLSHRIKRCSTASQPG